MEDLKQRIAKAIAECESKQEMPSAVAARSSKEAAEFYEGPARAAFAELKEAFESQGRSVDASTSKWGASVKVKFEGRDELYLQFEVHGTTIRAIAQTMGKDGPFRSLGAIRPGNQSYGIADVTQAEIVEFVLNRWEDHMRHAR